MSNISNQVSDDISQEIDSGGQMSEVNSQVNDVSSQVSEVGSQVSDVNSPVSGVSSQVSDVSSEASDASNQGNDISNHLRDAIQRENWTEVLHLLQHGQLDERQKKWALEEACQLSRYFFVLEQMFQHCSDDILESVLPHLVTRHFWSSVGTLLQRGSISCEGHRWVVEQASEQCLDFEFRQFISPHCDGDILETVLPHIVIRRLWSSVSSVLRRNVISSEQHRWAVRQASEHCSDLEFTHCILPHCSDDLLETVLPCLATRLMFSSVDIVLQQNISSGRQRMAIQQAVEVAELDWDFIKRLFRHCADDYLESVLRPLVERGLWHSVSEMLERHVSDSSHGQTTEEANNSGGAHRPGEDDPICGIHWTKDLSGFVEQRRRRRSGGGGAGVLIYCMVPYCNRRQLDAMLTPLVEGGLWQLVGRVLDRGVSLSECRWAVDKGCRRGDETDILRYILPHCVADQLDSVLLILVERGLWEFVGKVLEQGGSDSEYRWVTNEACRRRHESAIRRYIIPNCPDSHLDAVLRGLVERGLWQCVGEVLIRGVSDSLRNWVINEACEKASEEEIMLYIFPHCAANQLDIFLALLVKHCSWRYLPEVLDQGANLVMGEICEKMTQYDLKEQVIPRYVYSKETDTLMTQLAAHDLCDALDDLLSRFFAETVRRWVIAGDNVESDDTPFWKLVDSSLCKKVSIALCSSSKRCEKGMKSAFEKLFENKLGSTLPETYKIMCNVLLKSIVEVMMNVWLSGQTRDTETDACKFAEEALYLYGELHKSIRYKNRDSEMPLDTSTDASYLLPKLQKLCMRNRCGIDRTNPLFSLHFIKTLIQQFCTSRRWDAYNDAFLVTLAMIPVVPDIQNVVLTVMFRQKRWDVISLACLSHLWEHGRRRLFQAAVEQKQWNAVKNWTDHTLYGDQRFWALGEALREKQWDVMLVLADHGLTEDEVVRVHYLIAKYADWNTVGHMFKREADLSEVRELVALADPRVEATSKSYDHECRWQRVRQLAGLEIDLKERIQTLKTVTQAARCGEWHVVVHSIRHRFDEDLFRLSLKMAVAKKVWHVVNQLIRLGISPAALPPSFFHEMVARQQWGVCSVLLQLGWNDSCVDTLPKFMETSQWLLVARLMEYDVGDALRRDVMQRAWEKREGSIVWHCLSTMQDDRLSVKEREEFFQQALLCEVWQAIKPLIEHKDSVGIKHRDIAFLKAIDQHLWDVVDHGLRQKADINMQDNEGHTPIHRAARKKDWEAVTALTTRGGDPSPLDNSGLSVLHMAIKDQQWDLVKLLILYQGDIHKAANDTCYNEKRTPLEMLIDTRQGEIIDFTLMWCPDQGKGVNNEGETALHAVCLSGWFNNLYYIVARGVNPFKVTKKGHSALFYAVLSKKTPQKMVAECIKLGFSTHQPHITDTAEDSLLVSPLVLSVLRGLPVVTQMLYESGACSYRELFRLYTQQRALMRPDSRKGRDLQWSYRGNLPHDMRWDIFWNRDTKLIKQSARYLIKLATTPRSLQSTCRLVISLCLNVRSRRHRHRPLPLPEFLKNYAMFSDLADQNYDQYENHHDDVEEGDEEECSDEEEYSDENEYWNGDWEEEY